MGRTPGRPTSIWRTRLSLSDKKTLGNFVSFQHAELSNNFRNTRGGAWIAGDARIYRRSSRGEDSLQAGGTPPGSSVGERTQDITGRPGLTTGSSSNDLGSRRERQGIGHG